MAPRISDTLDGGAITVVATEPAVVLRLKREKCQEACGTFQQWFHFCASNLAPGTPVEYCIEDAGQSTYPDWDGYNVCMSYDLEDWHRVDSSFADGKLRWTHTPTCSMAFYAYFPPYSRDRQLRMIGKWQQNPRCLVEVLGQTLDGRDLHMLRIGSPPAPVAPRAATGKKTLWVHARQHPGETAASWWVDGFVGRLLDGEDGVARELLKRADVFVIPNANPDGGVRGHLRTNAAGANLNREWAEPALDRSPEVFLMRQAMETLGSLDIMMDIHQDEEKPYTFISRTPLGVPRCTPALRAAHARFRAAYTRACPDFETPGPVEPVGYPEPAAGKANLAICSAWVAERFGGLSLTVEMPYKGNPNAGEAEGRGWTTRQCAELGRGALNAMLDHLVGDAGLAP